MLNKLKGQEKKMLSLYVNIDYYGVFIEKLIISKVCMDTLENSQIYYPIFNFSKSTISEGTKK